jgi:hypothetical protein
MSDASYANNLTPEDAMNILRFYGEKIWEKIDNKIWNDELPGPLWVRIYDAVERLEHGPEPETLIELVELTEYERNEIYQLWNKLSERQREKLIQDIKRENAKIGFVNFLETVAEALTAPIITNSKEGRRDLEYILSKAEQFIDAKIGFDELMNSISEHQFMNAKIGFDELMNATTELLSLPKRSRDPKLFYKKGVALGKYLTGSELKKHVENILIGKLDKELREHRSPYED